AAPPCAGAQRSHLRCQRRREARSRDDDEAPRTELSAEEGDASPDAAAAASSMCNVSVQRLLPTSLVARWDSSFGFQCDVLIYTTNNHGRAFFSASFNRAISPVVVEHLGVTGGQQELRLCVGCGMSRYRRFGQGRSRGQQSGDQVAFCCVDFSLDELKGDKSWRLNRKPIESTLVACFMTLVIIVWSVAALIWPVPIIAGFLPNARAACTAVTVAIQTLHANEGWWRSGELSFDQTL
uniref:Transmembrane protein 158 n=1 Tax=Scophthalmus maximus TaxID=52904 RepID=A0A8D3BMI5_SCOMX